MSRKFLFCFPLRMGNIIFGYIMIIFGLVLLFFEIYQIALMFLGHHLLDEKVNTDSHNNGTNFDMYNIIVLSYLAVYAAIGFLLSLFATVYTIGAYKLSYRAIKSFFVYSFIHISFTIVMLAWEAVQRDWVMLGVLAVSDVILIASLFGVKYFIDAVKSGRVYHRPEAYSQNARM
ncbi:uncharacterized protein LOC123661116 [Melitaea cinxia]|uniref:uncharacterized protein LOC123661116 n=1 Tax=Melitaea cinxia TaxID=113334 RepID=UPI001E273B33|nr:uncharacterized protein LOC123661116 [Melitaea cinxia]